MTLAAGSRLGAYEIVAPLGAGGMGQVYRARDTKLGRAVAIKVLPERFASDRDALARFEREARAVAALSHPNILGIYDFGTEDRTAFAVMELLEGETLRQKLSASLPGSGADLPRGHGLPVRKAAEYARQIAQGLAAAHEKGIVHRDLKPENVFVTGDGQVKILDFGLAKQQEAGSEDGTESPTRSRLTEPGTVMGTVGYMSPEQVRGRPTDHRSDIFSFGAVLYEMLAGQRAFSGDSAVETMNAILTADPPELPAQAGLPPGLERVVRRCLEKSPDERFQSARDLAFALDALTGASFAISSAVPFAALPASRRARSWRAIAAATGGLALLAVGAWLVPWPRFARAEPPSFQRLTFSRGTIRSARFTPDGQSAVFGASWNGAPLRLFLTRLDSLGASPIALPDAGLLAIARNGELAVSVGHRFEGIWTGQGTLARASLMGGAVRELIQDTRAADFAPDSSEIAVVRRTAGRDRLELPAGKVLYETPGYVSHARVSPSGREIAFLDHPVYGDNRGSVAFVEVASGRRRTLTPEYPSAEGLAWSPDGREIWFSASGAGEDNSLRAVTPAGRLRAVYRAPATLVLHDIAPDGRALLTQEQFRGEISVRTLGETQDRDLSLLDLSGARALSADGRVLLITQFGSGSGSNYAVYLQKTDGSPAVRLGEGDAADISRDGRLALAIVHGSPSRLALLPTGTGEVRTLVGGSIVHATAAFLPDGRRVLTCGTQAGRGARCFVQDTQSDAPPRAVTEEGVHADRSALPRVSPDGQRFVAVGPDGRPALYPIDGGSPQPVNGMADDEVAIEWTADGEGLYVQRTSGVPRKIDRLELRSGRRTPFREITPADPAGVLSNLGLLLTPDGRGHAIVFYRLLSTLYLAQGLR